MINLICTGTMAEHNVMKMAGFHSVDHNCLEVWGQSEDTFCQAVIKADFNFVNGDSHHRQILQHLLNRNQC